MSPCGVSFGVALLAGGQWRATVPPVSIAKVAVVADGVELDRCLLSTIVTQQHELDHRRDGGRHQRRRDSPMRQWSRRGGSGRLLRAVTRIIA